MSNVEKKLRAAVAALESERDRIDAKIASLHDALDESPRGKRGRSTKARGKPNWSPEARAAASARAKRRWAKDRREKRKAAAAAGGGGAKARGAKKAARPKVIKRSNGANGSVRNGAGNASQAPDAGEAASTSTS